jgi:hypothetical protein
MITTRKSRAMPNGEFGLTSFFISDLLASGPKYSNIGPRSSPGWRDPSAMRGSSSNTHCALETPQILARRVGS